MPNRSVTVSAKLVKQSVTAFLDVADDVYYRDAVLWAVSESITSGTGDATFNPHEGCTRAQIVTFLYRYLSK